MFAVALSALALAGTASSVPVSGGSAAQRAIVSRVLAEADPGVISSARIDARHYLVLTGPAGRLRHVRFWHGAWEAALVAEAATATLAGRNEPLAGYQVPSGQIVASAGPSQAPVLNAVALQRYRAVVLGRAHAGGLAVRAARVLRIGTGGLDVVVRLREDQLLDAGLTAALTALLSATGPPHFLAVEAPDGTAIAYGGTFANGGTWSYGGDTGTGPVPRSVPRRLWHAPTDLLVQMTRGIGLVRAHTARIACDGTAPPARGSLCRRVLADRWALLVPAAGNVCAGSPLGAWNVSVQGTLAGRAVNRSYDGCFAGTVQRWARLLGV
jgi:hypothetical protein